MKNQIEERNLYTEKEAANVLRVAPITLYRARKEGKLAYHKIGRRLLFTGQNLLDYFASCEKKISEVNV